MVRHIVHLNVLSSSGQRTREPQVMQLPEVKFLLEGRWCPPRRRWSRCGPRRLILPGASSSLVSWSRLGRLSLVLSRVFLPDEKKDGKGLLMDRAWRGLALVFPGLEGWSESDEDESSSWPTWYPCGERGTSRDVAWARGVEASTGTRESLRTGHGAIIPRGAAHSFIPSSVPANLDGIHGA